MSSEMQNEITQPTKDDIDRCAIALEGARNDLKRIQDVVGGFVHQTCLQISFERHSNDWYRVAGESRVKDAAGIARALKEKDAEPDQIWEINDIVGARAVVVSLSDANLLADELMKSNSVLLTEMDCKPIDHKESGYRALHIKGWLDDGGRRVGCEIQIRTGLQDAFSVISRSHLYKSGGLPHVLTELGRAQADHLATIDRSFELIKSLVHDYDVSPIAKSQSTTGESPVDVLP